MKTVSLAAATALAAAGCAIAVPSAAATAPPPCGNHALAVSASRSQGATGHGNFILRFRNKTDSACTLYGYPGLDALAKDGHVLRHARRTLHGFTGGSTHGLRRPSWCGPAGTHRRTSSGSTSTREPAVRAGSRTPWR
jgi:hypothetical protein